MRWFLGRIFDDEEGKCVPFGCCGLWTCIGSSCVLGFECGGRRLGLGLGIGIGIGIGLGPGLVGGE